MKTMKYFFGIVALSLLTAIGVNAQQIVTQGSTHHYHVTDHAPKYTYGWSIALPQPGNVIAHADSSGTLITWGTSGNYTITLTETNSSGGCATPNTFLVTVLGAAHLQFTQPISANCANLDQVLTLQFTDGTADISGNANYFPLVVNYTVAGVPLSKTFNFGDPLTITLTGTSDRKDKAAYADWTILVTLDLATANGGTVTFDANKTNTNTVYDVPDLNPIVAD